MANSVEVTRRRVLAAGAVSAALGQFDLGMASNAAEQVKPKAVAGIVTRYEKGLHGDVVFGKIMEGWKQDGGPGPALKLASMYVEQFTGNDLARPMAEKHGVPIFDSIEKAVTVGGDSIPVDGVVSIGEHGSYPYNDKGQHLYPRRRFFEEITDAFKKYNRVVPVFNDKHLGPEWDDAIWMYERAREMKVPFMAGSSIPVTFRKMDAPVPIGTKIEAAIGIGYSGLDIYGSHTLEAFQCLVERRAGAEVGVEWVQCLEGNAMWDVVDNELDQPTLQAALKAVRKSNPDKLRAPNHSLFLFRYKDGLLGAVLMLPAYSSGFSVALKIKGRNKPLATQFIENPEPAHPHFAYLVKGIERMMHTGKPSYPVERTLLTSGILDRALTSRHEGHKKLDTPELAIEYTPVDYPYGPLPELTSDPRAPLA